MTEAQASTKTERAGPGAAIAAARLWLALLVLASLAQLYFVLRARGTIPVDLEGSTIPLYRVILVSVALRALVAGVGLYALMGRLGRRALILAVAAMFFVNPIAELLTGPALDYVSMGTPRFRLWPVRAPLELTVNAAVTLWLLLSPRANRAFGIDTSRQVTTGAPRLWTRLRGRDIPNNDIPDLQTR